MFKNFPLIVKNCWRNRRRTTLTILSIGASLCLLGILMAVYQAFYLSDGAPEQALRLVTRNKVGLAATMPQAYEPKIKALPGVHEVMVANWYGGTYIDDKPEHQFARFATEADKLFTIRPEMKLSDEEKAAFLHDRRGCIIGKELADKLKLKDGDRMTLIGDIYPGNLDFTVRGVYDAPIDNGVFYFDKAYIEEGLPDRRKGNVGIFCERFPDGCFGRRHLHDPSGLGQHHRHVRARTNSRNRRSESSWIHERHGARNHSG